MKRTKAVVALASLLVAGLGIGCGDMATPTDPLQSVDSTYAERWHPPQCPPGMPPPPPYRGCIPSEPDQ